MAQTCPPNNIKLVNHSSGFRCCTFPAHYNSIIMRAPLEGGVGGGFKTYDCIWTCVDCRWKVFSCSFQLVGRLWPHRQPAAGWVLSRHRGCYGRGFWSSLGLQKFVVSYKIVIVCFYVFALARICGSGRHTMLLIHWYFMKSNIPAFKSTVAKIT